MIHLTIVMDSDEDYVDLGDIYSEDEEDFVKNRQKEKEGQGRGGDINWIEVAQFDSVEDFQNLDFYRDINQYFTMRKGRENNYADTETYYCKFSRRKMFKICPRKYRVCFLSTCDDVRPF